MPEEIYRSKKRVVTKRYEVQYRTLGRGWMHERYCNTLFGALASAWSNGLLMRLDGWEYRVLDHND